MSAAYPKLLHQLQDAILSGDVTHAAGAYKDKLGFPARAQLSVYAEGYRIRLIKAVSADYPGLRHYLGDADFDALVKDYVEATPSRHYNLEVYSHGFAAFAAARCEDAFLQEVAAFEGAIREVVSLPDSPALGAEFLAGLAPESLAELTLAPRAACRLLALDYPISRMLTALREGESPAPPTPEASYTAIYRHPFMIRRLECERDEFTLLRALAEGRALGEVLSDGALFSDEAVEAMVPKLSEWFRRWVENGLLREPGNL